MNDLIKALQIFLKYNEANEYPTHCEHDILYIVGVDPDNVSDEDKEELSKLGFEVDDECEGFISYRFGSA